MPEQSIPVAKLLGAYCQVSDLRRSLAFYRDVMGLEVAYSDETIAILHARNAAQDSIVLRAMGEAPHHLGDSGVTRLFWRVLETADLDIAEGVLAKHGISHDRHKEETSDGLSFRDPDGLAIVLIRVQMKKADSAPPSWLSWAH